VRGRGYFLGIELVRDRETKQPFPAQRAISYEIGEACVRERPHLLSVRRQRRWMEWEDTIIIAPPFNARMRSSQNSLTSSRSRSDRCCGLEHRHRPQHSRPTVPSARLGERCQRKLEPPIGLSSVRSIVRRDGVGLTRAYRDDTVGAQSLALEVLSD